MRYSLIVLMTLNLCIFLSPQTKRELKISNKFFSWTLYRSMVQDQSISAYLFPRTTISTSRSYEMYVLLSFALDEIGPQNFVLNCTVVVGWLIIFFNRVLRKTLGSEKFLRDQIWFSLIDILLALWGVFFCEKMLVVKCFTAISLLRLF